jgi:outer membrane protein
MLWALRLPAAPQTAVSSAAPVDPIKEGPVTLVDCINIALQNNTKILVAQQAIEKAKGIQVTARAVWYPSVTTSAFVEMRDDDVWDDKNPAKNTTDGFKEDWKLDVLVRESIFSGGKNSATIDNARLENEIAFIQFQIETNDAVLQTKQAFYELLVSRKEYEIEQQNVDLLRQELARQKILFDAGRSTRFNIVRTEVRLSNEIPNELEAQNRIELAKLQLLNVLGLRWGAQVPDLPDRLKGVLDCPKVEFPLDQLLALARKQRPEPGKWDREIQQETNNATIARALNIPKLDAYVGATARRDYNTTSGDMGNNFFDNRTEAGAGFLGAWNIFDGFRAKGLVMQADAKKKSAAIELDNSWRQIDLEVRRGYLKLKEAEATLASQTENVKRAFESLDLSRTSVDAGYGTQYDVIQSTTDLNTAQSLENRARLNYHLALAELESATFSYMKGLHREEVPLNSNTEARVNLRGMQPGGLR